MYALVFIVLFGGLATFIAQRINNLMSAAWGFHDRARALALAAAAPEIERFYRLTGCLPASPSDFTVPNTTSATPCPGQVSLTGKWPQSPSGFEQVRENIDPAMHNLNAWDYVVATATPVSDGTWKFNRVALYALDPQKAADDNDYVNNYQLAPAKSWEAGTSCDVNPYQTGGSFAQGSSWCGDMASWWWRFEEKQLFPAMIARQRIWQQRTLGKIAAFYNGFQAWPAFITNNTSNTLASVAGAPSNLAQANCTRPYEWQIGQVSVPLDCTDLYNQWGNPVSYNFQFNATTGMGTFYLLSQTRILDPNSTTNQYLYVTSELSL